MSESFAKVNVMSFSDEPTIVSESGWNRRRVVALVLGLSFIGVFLVATVTPWRQDAARAKTERGPNHGFVHHVGDLELELIRIADGWQREQDALIVVISKPDLNREEEMHSHDHDHHHDHPHDHSHDHVVNEPSAANMGAEHGLEGTVRLEWRASRNDPWRELLAEDGYFGPSEHVLQFNRDYRIQLRLIQNDNVLFEEPFWAYSSYLADTKGHDHAH